MREKIRQLIQRGDPGELLAFLCEVESLPETVHRRERASGPLPAVDRRRSYEAVRHIARSGNLDALQRLLDIDPSVVPESDRAFMAALVLAATQQPDLLIEVVRDDTREASFVVKFGSFLLCEELDAEMLQEVLAAYQPERTVAQCFRDAALRRLDSIAEADAPKEQLAGGIAGRDSVIRALSMIEEVDDFVACEIARSIAFVRGSSRSQHLFGTKQLPAYAEDCEPWFALIPGLRDELELRRLLDVVSEGAWHHAVLLARRMLSDASLRRRSSLASVLERFCCLQLGYVSDLAQHSQITEGSEAEFEGSLLELVELLEGVTTGTEPYVVLHLPSHEEPREGGQITRIVALLRESGVEKGTTALVELGNIADELLRGARFSRALATWLRVLQAHSLLFRGHYKYAHRVSDYSLKLIRTHGLEQAGCASFAERDSAILSSAPEVIQ